MEVDRSPGKEEEGVKFSDYFDASEAVRNMPSHRVLALLRGRKEGFLRLAVVLPDETNAAGPTLPERRIAARAGIENKGRPADGWLTETVRWTWKVKLLSSLENDTEHRLREQAEAEAIRVFGRNLHDLLLTAPAGPARHDGARSRHSSGVKVAVVDGTGKLLDTATVYPHEPRNDWEGSIRALGQLCARHGVQLVAIGNGTASRETDKLAGDVIARVRNCGSPRSWCRKRGFGVFRLGTGGAGIPEPRRVASRRRLDRPPAAGPAGRARADRAESHRRRSVSARRQPASAREEARCRGRGLRQRGWRGRQHRLGAAPGARLGLSQTIARNIVSFRDEHGPFRSRQRIRDVPRLGDRTFQQAAGFLRIMNGDNPLDASAVHPEAPVVQRIVAGPGFRCGS